MHHPLDPVRTRAVRRLERETFAAWFGVTPRRRPIVSRLLLWIVLL